MEIKIGDTVISKQGGPYMTVDYIVGYYLPQDCEVYYAPGLQKGSVICTWINELGHRQGTVYDPKDLQHVQVFV